MLHTTSSRLTTGLLAAVAAVLVLPAAASAHFLWVLPEQPADNSERVHVYFSEVAEGDDPALLDRLTGLELLRLRPNHKPETVELKKDEDSFVSVRAYRTDEPALYALKHSWGVFSRGGNSFLLNYVARSGPAAGSELWQQVETGKLLPLDLVPSSSEDGIRISATWQGQPLPKAEWNATGPDGTVLEGTTDAQGRFTFQPAEPGVWAIRVKHTEDKSGTVDGKKYSSVRWYSTLALRTETAAAAGNGKTAFMLRSELPDLPEGITSFGGAIAGDRLYVYGGHMGRAHSYSTSDQSGELRSLDLTGKDGWKKLAGGPKMQGLALVAWNNQLYRAGGFTARNAEGEDHDLHSRDLFARYNPADDSWTELPALPEPRSSHDAAVLGSKLYVVGGWQLDGAAENRWHETAHVIDLSAKEPVWKALPKPPFTRRALALAAHQNRLYVIGGMQQEGGPTTKVSVFDPETGKWSEGPSLVGEPMNGFGCSAFAADGRLYVTTIHGQLQRLTEDGSAWEVVRQLDRPRFFHRMLPVSGSKMLMVGGASMKIGRFEALDVIDLSQAVTAARQAEENAAEKKAEGGNE
ncbi:MAG: DUF4198 domain-containing protein [Planctomycetaceae bacterium]|nr:DUF4198 domain-containing protein [Planctomycetaceae bacterium]